MFVIWDFLLGTVLLLRQKKNSSKKNSSEKKLRIKLFGREMAYTMLTWSIQLHRLADQLIRDEPLLNRNSDVYQRHRRLIQNNMDAAR